MADAPLTRCPFCKGPAHIKAVARDWWKLVIDHADECMLSGRLDDAIVPQEDEHKAWLAERWNRRALQPDWPAPEIEEALHEAVAAIYFDDSSKFRSALGCVVRSLDHRLAGRLLCHPKAAYDESLARRDAARAGPDAPAAARVAIQLVGHWDMHGIQPVHWVPGILRGTFPDGTPLYTGSLTEDQRKDLLAAAITIAARKDPTCVLSADDEERILGLLSDLAGMALEAAREAPHA